MLGRKESTHRSEDASNVFTFMTIVIITSFILYTVVCGLSALSGLCSVLVSCVFFVPSLFYQFYQQKSRMYLKNAMYSGA